MRKVILMMVLAIISNSARAEFTCEKIKDKATRVSCITDRIEKEKSANETKVAEDLAKSKRKFDMALRSALAISAATEVGITYVNFGQLLNNLATEIAIVKGQAANPFETDTIDNLNKILDIYKDSSALWDDLIDANSSSMQLEADHIIFGFYPRTAEITKKYDLPITKDNSPIFSGPDSLYGPRARSILWENASVLVETLRASIQ